MAANDVTITAASVVKGSGAATVTGIAGVTITAGQVLYIDTSNSSVMKLADADSTSLTAGAAGIALHAALTGQPITYLTQGPITIGGTLVAGTWYIVSATAGSLTKSVDQTTGWLPCLLGYASTTAILQVGIIPTGVTL